jgi:rubredoxin
MPRELVWIKEKSRWGCSVCSWLFSASRVPVQGTMEDMLSKFEEELQQEFLRHVCSDHP